MPPLWVPALALLASLNVNVLQLAMRRGPASRRESVAFVLACIGIVSTAVMLSVVREELSTARDLAHITPPCVLEGGPLSPWAPH